MIRYVALLRGINLGKRQLKMADLKQIGIDHGLDSPATFIASGNLLFGSDRPVASLKADLEQAIAAHLGAPVPVMIRLAEEMAAVAAGNPFADQPGNRVVAIFLDDAPSDLSTGHLTDEQVVAGKREIYVHYPQGQGPSKLVIPAAVAGTARNMNSVAKIAELLKEKA